MMALFQVLIFSDLVLATRTPLRSLSLRKHSLHQSLPIHSSITSIRLLSTPSRVMAWFLTCLLLQTCRVNPALLAKLRMALHLSSLPLERVVLVSYSTLI
ncbi:hypothetical protein EDD86DRAFT_49974 [Gorgonomyces haynaldii]|nr:hypothetical protein EDD86DRAFT_49974 [Gorgonomyces haynaldii]